MGTTKIDVDTPRSQTYIATPPRTTTSRTDATSSEIKSNIDHTRDEMDETLNALGERLNPRHMLDQVFDLFRGSGGSGRDTTETMKHTAETMKDLSIRAAHQIRRHPMPSLLIGAGLAWLLTEDEEREQRVKRYRARQPATPEHAGSFVDARTGEPYDESYGEEWRRHEGEHERAGEERSWTESAKHAGSRASEAASHAGQSIRETTAGAGEKIRETASRARDRASEMTARAGHYTSEKSRQLQHSYHYSRDRLTEAVEDYPLAVGVACSAIGLLAGLMMPRTRTEDEIMGEQAAEFKDQVRRTSSEAWERGQHVVSATASAAAEEAERQGLTPEKLAEKVQHVATEAGHAAREEATHAAREEGVSGSSLADKAKNVAQAAKETAEQETKRQGEQMRNK